MPLQIEHKLSLLLALYQGLVRHLLKVADHEKVAVLIFHRKLEDNRKDDQR